MSTVRDHLPAGERVFTLEECLPGRLQGILERLLVSRVGEQWPREGQVTLILSYQEAVELARALRRLGTP